jgi:hypothetical protein
MIYGQILLNNEKLLEVGKSRPSSLKGQVALEQCPNISAGFFIGKKVKKE